MEVCGWLCDGDWVFGVVILCGEICGDKVLLVVGVWSGELLKLFGLELFVVLVKG